MQPYLLEIPPYCTEDSGDDTATRDYRPYVIAMGIFLLCIIMLIVISFVIWRTRKSHNAKGSNTLRQGESAEYAEISRSRQETPQLDGELTTVYDELQPGRVRPSTVES
ncbi:hypothetical protein GJAV_G00065770 [Gymnothorax javanicus]|nr:hypothetical protein GJAV_G00065770 [Gymnothorax javanicus]